jgi:hypothetical protein
MLPRGITPIPFSFHFSDGVRVWNVSTPETSTDIPFSVAEGSCPRDCS